MEESQHMAKRITKKYPPVNEMTPSEQVGLVREVFATIPRRYDFLNRFFSLRRDVAWRRFAVRKMRFFQTMRFLDVATGTADLAVETVRRHPPVRVAGLDFVREMMVVGRRKIRRNRMADRIGLIQGDALSLPFNDNIFDVAAIAFGIRNIPDRRRALEEMKRVVVPGGQVMALEMNFPRHQLFRRFTICISITCCPAWRAFFHETRLLIIILAIRLRSFRRRTSSPALWSSRVL
jgi:demethylmenaquinone methyltransferase/2-methoxy-6-polyprenyl-1,4-benzoquinol methylase